MTSIILYPRAYNKRGESHLHSVKGVTEDGKSVNIKLRVDEKYKSLANCPSISEFAREDRKAKIPCISSPYNSPENREGVLLFNSCEFEKEDKEGTKIYTAKWGHVLAEDSESPNPIIGVGRVSVRRDSQKIREAKSRLLDKSLTEEQRSGYQRIANDPSNFLYSMLIYEIEKSFVSENRIDAQTAIENIINERTMEGIVGGVLIRSIDSGLIYKEKTIELFPSYKISQGGYQSGQEIANIFSGRYDWSQEKIEIIPVRKINCGPRGNTYYGSSQQFSMIEANYYNEDNEPQIRSIVGRVTYLSDQKNTLLSRVFPLTNFSKSIFELKTDAINILEEEYIPIIEKPIKRDVFNEDSLWGFLASGKLSMHKSGSIDGSGEVPLTGLAAFLQN